MSGHSKFANIRHRKDAQDAKRAKLFVKIVREIIVAVQKGGSDPNSNATLRLCLEKARANNMPKDNYERAIKKASGNNDVSNYETIRYEGYGPANVAFIVDCLTDNRNRTASNVRNYFTKKNGNLGQPNSVAYLFQPKGMLSFFKQDYQEEALWDLIFETSADDLQQTDEEFVIFTAPDQLMEVKSALMQNGITGFTEAKIMMSPVQPVDLTAEQQEAVLDFINILEDDDDVQAVYTNAQFNE